MSTAEDDRVRTGLSVIREEVTDAELAELGVDLVGDFPGSTAADFRRYPVLSEGGWFVVVKHQPSLRSVSREAWGLLGPIALASTGLDIA
ncbi:hypothetical protein ACQP04_25855 [Pseudonocardia halophobica]|uniref:hypothetical protein n=1 Tax=Pseudonocardia halophobica TaxID=29401 RepID=UPI003D8D2805